MGKDNVRQHVIPQFYLVEFADPTGQVHCLNVYTEARFTAKLELQLNMFVRSILRKEAPSQEVLT